MRHPDEAREVDPLNAEGGPEFFTVCDAETGTCQQVPFGELPQTCLLKKIEVEDEDGNMVVKTVLLCDDDDIALQEEIDSYKGDRAARENPIVHTTPKEESTEGEICPLCGALPQYQRLVWSLPAYHELLEDNEAAMEAKFAAEDDAVNDLIPA